MQDERKTKQQLIAELKIQRRELQTEQALERVRSRIAAMQQSEELVAVGEAIRLALVELGLAVDLLGFNLIDATEMRTWWADEYIATVPLQEALETSAGQQRYDLWKKGTNRLVFRDRDQHRRHYEQTLAAGMPQEVADRHLARSLETLGDAEGHWILEVPFVHGTLAAAKAAAAAAAFTNSEIGLVERFTEVFALGYRRYAELEAAEQQAAQMQLERAVERVRAEAMAMRASDDLFKVVAVVHDELIDLGIDLGQCKIGYIDEENDYHSDYVAIANPRQFGIDELPPGITEISDKTIVWLEEHTVTELRARGDDFYERWAKGEPWSFTSYEVAAQQGRERPDPQPEGFNREFSRKLGILLPDNTIRNHSMTIVPFARSHVSIHMMGLEPVDVDLVKAFTEAISLGYLRFLDFDKVDKAQRQLIDELEAELQTARQLQMSLMPTASPEIPGYDIAGRCETVNHVGGDFFQYFQRDGHLSIGLADVTGHAMEAAVPVMVFSGVLKTEMRHSLPLDQLFANLNHTMHDSLPNRTFVCFCMGEIDLQQNTVRLANGGCPYPLHYSAQTGQIAELQVDAYPLGVRAPAEYRTVAQSLAPGDYLVFCSDGLIEAANDQGDIYGFEQTAETIRQSYTQGLAANALIDHLVAAVQAFAGDEPQGDDMTCVALRVTD